MPKSLKLKSKQRFVKYVLFDLSSRIDVLVCFVGNLIGGVVASVPMMWRFCPVRTWGSGRGFLQRTRQGRNSAVSLFVDV